MSHGAPGEPRNPLTEPERKVMDLVLESLESSNDPIDLPLDVVAWWLKPREEGGSKREALEISRSLIRKGYIKGELGWDTIYGVTLGIAHPDKRKVSTADPGTAVADKQNILVVHGHDLHLKEVVARFIERLGFNAVILAEKPGGGRTLIEQVERYSNVAYAVVLLTPDDMVENDDGAPE